MTAYLKSLVGGLIAFLGSVEQAADHGITAAEWVHAAIAGLVALGIVWGVPNIAPKTRSRRRDRSEQDHDAGYATSGGLLAALIVILVLIVFFTGLIHSPLIFLLLLVALLVLFL